MNQKQSVKASAAEEAPAAATSAETIAALVERAKRDQTPLLKAFVQNPDKTLENRSGPLGDFVRRGDLRALKALLLLHTIISSGDGDNGWSTTLPLGAWARALGTTETASPRSASTAATKILTRLRDRDLIDRSPAKSRKVTITLLRPDGSRDPYTRPGKDNADRFLRLDNRYWTESWHEKLDLPATAMLLVALHEKPGFSLPTERVPDWYGWSADTAERGLKTLQDNNLLLVEKRTKKAPLSPTGLTVENIYALNDPFGDPDNWKSLLLAGGGTRVGSPKKPATSETKNK